VAKEDRRERYLRKACEDLPLFGSEERYITKICMNVCIQIDIYMNECMHIYISVNI
jgi:hypothetical protein